MKRSLLVILLFVVLPAAELALLLYVGSLVGIWPTIGLIILTGIVGGRLALGQGLRVWSRLQERLASGAIPGTELVDGAIILVSGALLVTPGILTDLAGFMGLVPAARAGIRKATSAWLAARVGMQTFVHAPQEERESWQGTPNRRPHYAE